MNVASSGDCDDAEMRVASCQSQTYHMGMRERDELHSLVDRLPPGEVPIAQRYLEYLVERGEDTVARALSSAPEDDEPVEETDIEALREAVRELESGGVVSGTDVRRLALNDP